MLTAKLLTLVFESVETIIGEKNALVMSFSIKISRVLKKKKA